tara:strand:+ start:41 stop:1129 length:1089 start_codon:yes stop_codon:yes gene_type:complete
MADGNFFTNIIDALGGLKLSDLAGTGLSLAAYDDLADRLSTTGTEYAKEIGSLAESARSDSKFKPFTISTGFGDVGTRKDAEGNLIGGFETDLDPTATATTTGLRNLTANLLSPYGTAGTMPTGATLEDGRGVNTAIGDDALKGAQGLISSIVGGRGTREADVYERIRATQRPEEERQRLALQDQLLGQGRLGLQTAAYGGTPEQLALAKAQEEAKNRASLMALQQAGTERAQDLETSTGLFGLGSSARGLPAALTAADLGNIRESLALSYAPEEALLGTLTPGLNLAGLQDVANRYGVGLGAELDVGGLDAIAQMEEGRANLLAGLYSSLIGSQGQAEGQEGLFSKLFGGKTIAEIISDLI